MIQNKHKSLERILLLAFMILPTLAISLNLDNDFWFLLNHGNYIVNNGFPVIEPFTMHEGFEFIIQQWLFDVVVYFLYTKFGAAGVIALVYAVAIFIVTAIYKLCMLFSDGKFYLSVLITVYSYLLLCMWFMVTRPQIITYALLLTEIYCLEKYSVGKKCVWLIPLPLVSLMLINFHSSMWWLCFAFILPYIIETIPIKWMSINKDPLSKAHIYTVSALMIAMGFVNPYGHKAILYIFTSFGNDIINASILEMAVPDVKELTGLIYFFTLALLCFCYALNRDGKTRLRYILLALGTILLSLMSMKSIAYFLIGAFVPLAYNLKNQGDKLVFKVDSKKAIATVCGFVAVIYVASGFVLVKDYDAAKDFPETRDAVEYLSENADKEEVALYTSFFDGGYAEYMGFKAYIDARAEVFLKSNNKHSDIFEEYISLQNGSLHYKEFLSRYEFTHILVTESDALYIYLSQDEDHTIFYEDEHSKIFIPINN